MAEGEFIEPDDFAAEMSKPVEAGQMGRWETVGPPTHASFGTAGSGDQTAPAVDSANDLYTRITREGGNFWELVYEPFMDRDLNREQVKSFIKKGLGESAGNYRRLLEAIRLPASDYQRFMDFLRHHELKP
jgi:hypothetical protein